MTLRPRTTKRNRMNFDDEPKERLSYFEKVYFFLNSPMIKFFYDKVLILPTLVVKLYFA
jgi:hypothetical protein